MTQHRHPRTGHMTWQYDAMGPGELTVTQLDDDRVKVVARRRPNESKEELIARVTAALGQHIEREVGRAELERVNRE